MAAAADSGVRKADVVGTAATAGSSRVAPRAEEVGVEERRCADGAKAVAPVARRINVDAIESFIVSTSTTFVAILVRVCDMLHKEAITSKRFERAAAVGSKVLDAMQLRPEDYGAWLQISRLQEMGLLKEEKASLLCSLRGCARSRSSVGTRRLKVRHRAQTITERERKTRHRHLLTRVLYPNKASRRTALAEEIKRLLG